MFDFLKNLFRKKSLSKEEIGEIRAQVETKLSKARKNPKVVELEIDLKKKISKALAEILLKQMEKEYSEKLGKKVVLTAKNGN